MSLRYFDVTGAPYFAKGDGTTDDTTAIQNALNDADDNAGSTVFIPEGAYIVQGLTFAGSGSRIDGSGTLKLKNASSADYVLQISGGYNVVDGIRMDGNAAGAPTAKAEGILVSGDHNHLRDVRVDNTEDAGIPTGINFNITGDHNLIEGCWSIDAGSIAFKNDGDNNRYRDCAGINWGNWGIVSTIQVLSRVDIEGCFFESSTSASNASCINSTGSLNAHVFIRDCTTVGPNSGGTGSLGAYFAGSEKLVIENCKFQHSQPFDTIWFEEDLSHVSVRNCFVSRNLLGLQPIEQFVLDNCVIGDGTHAPTYSFKDLDAEIFVARDCKFVDFTTSAILWRTPAANYHHLEATNCLFHGKAASATTYDVTVAGLGAVDTSGNILWQNNRRENPETGGTAEATDNNERSILFTTRDSSKKLFEGTAAPADVDVTWAAGDLVYNTVPIPGARKVGWVYIDATAGWRGFGDVAC